MSAVEINEADTLSDSESGQLFKDLTWTQRMQGFLILLSMALFSTLMSWFALGMANYWKYTVLSSLGSFLSMLSTIVLMGPSTQLAYMFDEYRFNASVLYIGSLFLSAFVAIIFQSVLLCIVCSLLQYAALVWYSLSYVPYGRETLVNILLRREKVPAKTSRCFFSFSGTPHLPDYYFLHPVIRRNICGERLIASVGSAFGAVSRYFSFPWPQCGWSVVSCAAAQSAPVDESPSCLPMAQYLYRSRLVELQSMESASNFCLLHAKLSKLGFRDWSSVSEGDVMTGNPHTFAVFLRFLYRRFPAATAMLLRRYDWFLVEADDVRLGATTVRLLSTAASETNLISATQFGMCKYAMVKMNMCHALLRLLRSLRITPSSPAVFNIASNQKPMAIERSGKAAPCSSSSLSPNGHLRINERRSELNSVSRS